jgi:hypothetical protein
MAERIEPLNDASLLKSGRPRLTRAAALPILSVHHKAAPTRQTTREPFCMRSGVRANG